MKNLQKIISYIGFSIKARKIVYGVDNIIKKNRVSLVISTNSLSENSNKKIQNYCNIKNCKLITFDDDTLNDILKTNNCKAVAILDDDLANAIIENA